MIDSKAAFSAFKQKFDAMSAAERTQYLQRMGFKAEPAKAKTGKTKRQGNRRNNKFVKCEIPKAMKVPATGRHEVKNLSANHAVSTVTHIGPNKVSIRSATGEIQQVFRVTDATE